MPCALYTSPFFYRSCSLLPCSDLPQPYAVSHPTPCPLFLPLLSSCLLSGSKMGHLSLATLVPFFVPVPIPMHHPLPTWTTSASFLASSMLLPAHTSSSPPTTIGTIIPAPWTQTLPGSLAIAKADIPPIRWTPYVYVLLCRRCPAQLCVPRCHADPTEGKPPLTIRGRESKEGRSCGHSLP